MSESPLSSCLFNSEARAFAALLARPNQARLGKHGRLSMARLAIENMRQISHQYLADMHEIARRQHDVTGMGEMDLSGFTDALGDLLDDCIITPIEDDAERWERRYG